jgi:hypothetical protein
MAAAAMTTWGAAGLGPVYNPHHAKADHVKLPPNVTYAKGTVLGQITATGVFTAYATGAADGSQVAKRILQYDVATDANGYVAIGDQGEKSPTTPAWFCGTFKTSELTGLDAGAVTSLGRLISGSVTDGILRMG